MATSTSSAVSSASHESSGLPTCAPHCTGVSEFVGEAPHDEISALANIIRREIASCLDGRCKAEALNRFFFGTLRFTPETEVSMDGLLPASVLARRSGHCVGLAILYLEMAETLGLPVVAVAAPGHLFLRYEDDNARLNIDPLRNGRHFEDDWYIQEYKISDASRNRGVFLQSLSRQEVLAYIYVNLGFLYSRIGDFANAALLYRAALQQQPLLPSAHYNLGLDLLQQGDAEEALLSFHTAAELHPTEPWTLYARALAFCALGRTRRAARQLRDVIEMDEGFQVARERLATLTCEKGKVRRHR